MSIGEEGIHVDFQSYGNIILVKGQNLDIGDASDAADDEHFSNAAGKSSIAEIIVYALYGKTIRNKTSHTDVINTINKKKLEVEIGFVLDGRQYKVIRSRKPDGLQLWEDGGNITVGGQPATQQQIEDKIKLSHKAFINVVCFGQHNTYNLLDCDAADQRSIVESVLSLEVFKEYFKTAKEALKEVKQRTQELLFEYDTIRQRIPLTITRLSQVKAQEEQWRQNCLDGIASLNAEITNLEAKLEGTDFGAQLLRFDRASTEIEQINISIPDLQGKKEQLSASVVPARQKYDELRAKHHESNLVAKTYQQEVTNLKKEINTLQKELADLTALKEGAECPHCYSKIMPCNYKHLITMKNNQLDNRAGRIRSLDAKLELNQKEMANQEENLTKLKSLLSNADQKISTIESSLNAQQIRLAELGRIKRPDTAADALVLQERISHAKETLEQRKATLATGGPYKEIIAATEQELASIGENVAAKKKEVNASEELLPYYEYWCKAFGDDGIRSFIIEGIVPALNAKIAYWLGILIRGKLKVTFDKHLEALLERNPPTGDPFAYSVTSGAERNRINLAISQAFAHIVMLSSGTRPSLVFLDEVGANIERRGIPYIFDMICELAKDKQVFVVSHDAQLTSMLEGADVITIRKENGISVKL